MVSVPREHRLWAAASAYVERGWSVIPVVGKQPALATWKEFQTRLPDADELATWFTSPDLRPTGLGIVTGRLSGIVVVDCDSSADADNWLKHYLHSPLVVQTGGGGVHVYYQAPLVLVPNRVKLFHRQIDLRGDGGYVVAPPSAHSSGQRYAWAESPPDLCGTLPVFSVDWLLGDRYSQLPQGNSGSAVPVRKALAYIRHIRAVAGEGGHRATFRAACKLRDAGISPEEALALLRSWNETNAQPPWSHTELVHKVESAYQVGGRCRRAANESDVHPCTSHSSNYPPNER